MLLSKVAVVLGLLEVLTLHYVSAMDFSDYNFARDAVMHYSGGTERTVVVQMVKSSFPAPLPRRKPSGRKFGRWRKPRPGSSYGGAGVALLSSKDIGYEVLSSSWGEDRGYRGQPKAKLTYVQQKKTYKRRSSPSNTFLEAITAIERGVAEAKAAEKWIKKGKRRTIQAKSTINLAVKNRMLQYARKKLGQALYQLKHHTRTRQKRSSQNQTSQASSFMDDLKLTMGAENFDKFMAVMGDVTLMFAIDTTGSMSQEIETAKRIAVDVINYPRQNPVSYILSPFNDPGTGPVIYKNVSEGARFVKAISKLTASGGGDCPELTMKGILGALRAGGDWGSPLYVFTDASALDASETSIEEIKAIAKLQGNTINFFTTNECKRGGVFKPFQDIADATSGQVLRLLDYHELGQLSGFTGSVLGGSNIISSGSTAHRKKRSVGIWRYSIKVDESIEKMSVCITTKQQSKGANIALVDPADNITGVTNTSNKVAMARVSIYEIENPKVGTWTLDIPRSVGEHSYIAKSTSETNIDFEHYFMLTIPGLNTSMPVYDPLIGKQTQLVLTLAGYNKVQKTTLVLQLITKSGEHISDVSLTPDDRGMRFVATFTPPSRPFKLKIKGTTKAGNAFERVSRNIVEPKHVMLRALRSDEDFTLRRGQNSTVTFYIYNAGADPSLKISVKCQIAHAYQPPKSVYNLKRGEWAFTDVVFKSPRDAIVGAGDTAVVSLSYKGGIVMEPVQLIVVE